MKNATRIGLALGGAALAALAWFVMRWDRTILHFLYIWPVALMDVANVLDYLGSWMVTIPAVGLALAVFGRTGWMWLAFRPLAMLAASELVAESIKILVHRPRPDVIQHTPDFWGYSFPSEHAMCGLALWFTLGQVTGELWPEGRALVLTLASIAGLLAGGSQVFLGVNWPSDVLAGWGLALLLIAAMPGPYPPQAGRVKKKK